MFMAKTHGPGFVRLVDLARKTIKECTVDDIKRRLDAKERVNLIDVREESEFAADHLPGALHVGKGVIERDIEEIVPNHDAEIVLYCGGGFRSALAGENLVKMGYTNVISMDGGIRAWREKGYPVVR
jgi:rhodanese-related sulfurtransferase